MYYSFAISSAVKPVACEISKIIYSLPYYFSSNPQYVKDRFQAFYYRLCYISFINTHSLLVDQPKQ